MDEQEVFKEVIEILRPHTKDQSLLENATMYTSIINDLKVNSSRMIDLLLNFEETFGIAISDDAERICLIGGAVELIKEELGKTKIRSAGH
jgi:acyl carrier protein